MHRVLVHLLGGVVEDLPYVGVTGEAFREPFVERVDDIVSGQLSAVKRGLVVPHDALLSLISSTVGSMYDQLSAISGSNSRVQLSPTCGPGSRAG